MVVSLLETMAVLNVNQGRVRRIFLSFRNWLKIRYLD